MGTNAEASERSRWSDAVEPEEGRCPSCGAKGKRVGPVTIDALVKQPVPDGTEGFRFCATDDCDTVYFRGGAGPRFSRADVEVPVFQKEIGSERLVCYCFGHRVAAIESEVRETGSSKIPDEIAEKCRRGLDRCEALNPQGTCCLGNVRKVEKAAQEGPPKAGPDPKSVAKAPEGRGVMAASAEVEDCCSSRR
jgi:hypothetical protein